MLVILYECFGLTVGAAVCAGIVEWWWKEVPFPVPVVVLEALLAGVSKVGVSCYLVQVNPIFSVIQTKFCMLSYVRKDVRCQSCENYSVWFVLVKLCPLTPVV